MHWHCGETDKGRNGPELLRLGTPWRAHEHPRWLRHSPAGVPSPPPVADARAFQFSPLPAAPARNAPHVDMAATDAMVDVGQTTAADADGSAKIRAAKREEWRGEGSPFATAVAAC